MSDWENVVIMSANDVERSWNTVYSSMVIFTASRRTFAFVAEYPGLFHFLPSFFSFLSSVLKSQRLHKKRGEKREAQERKRGKGRKKRIRRERLHSSEVNFMLNYNSEKVWPRYVLVACYAKQFYSFPFFRSFFRYSPLNLLSAFF